MAGSADDVEKLAVLRAHVPPTLQYFVPWAAKYGLRGLTVHFGQRPSREKLATDEELIELVTAYEVIAARGDGPTITAWCLSVMPGTAANEAKEHIRGLLLIFERLAEYGIRPFTDERVRFLRPDPPPFNWNLLPPTLREWEPWLSKFEGLRTEADLYSYVRYASEDQVRELAALKELLDERGESLLSWCEASNGIDNPASREAFQAEWLFLLVDFAGSREDKR